MNIPRAFREVVFPHPYETGLLHLLTLFVLLHDLTLLFDIISDELSLIMILFYRHPLRICATVFNTIDWITEISARAYQLGNAAPGLNLFGFDKAEETSIFINRTYNGEKPVSIR